jgi:hypothetical protein
LINLRLNIGERLKGSRLLRLRTEYVIHADMVTKTRGISKAEADVNVEIRAGML